MQPQLAADTLQQVERVRRRTRSDLSSFWFPLVLFGALTLVGAAVVGLAGTRALGAYWALAGPAGSVVTGYYYWRRERRLGVEGPALPYVVTAVAMVVGALLAGGLGSASGSELAAASGPNLVVAAGLLMFSWLERSAALAALAGGLAALTLALAASGVAPRQVVLVLALAFGTAAIGTGLFYRLQDEQRA